MLSLVLAYADLVHQKSREKASYSRSCHYIQPLTTPLAAAALTDVALQKSTGKSMVVKTAAKGSFAKVSYYKRSQSNERFCTEGSPPLLAASRSLRRSLLVSGTLEKYAGVSSCPLR